MNIADILRKHQKVRPDHPAIEAGERIVTYGTLADMIDTCAANMRRRGILAGDVIALNLPDGVAHLVVLYALAKIGAVAFPMSGGSPPLEQRQLLEQVNAKLLVLGDGGTSPLASVPALPVGEIVPGGGTPDATQAEQVSTAGFDGNTPMIIIASSGTSAAAKLLILTHAQMLWRITTRERHIGFMPDDRYLSLIKLSFNLGRIRCMRAIQNGATVIFPSAKEGQGLIDVLRATRATTTNMMPNQVRNVFGGVKTDAPILPNLRLVIGSSPASADDRRRFRRTVTPHLYEVYAATEIGPIAVAAPEDQDAQPESVGHLAGEVEAQVVDSEDSPLPPGQVGQVRFRAPNLPAGYLNNPQATAKAFRAGWFYPGDLGAISAEGFLFLKGRDDDVINNEGAKFYPLEVETVLLTHAAVVEAVVLGVTHPAVGQAAVACVVADRDVSESELKEFCKERIAAFKTPFAIFFVESMPRNPAGKVRKRKLLEIVRQRLAARGGKPRN